MNAAWVIFAILSFVLAVDMIADYLSYKAFIGILLVVILLSLEGLSKSEKNIQQLTYGMTFVVIYPMVLFSALTKYQKYKNTRK